MKTVIKFVSAVMLVSMASAVEPRLTKEQVKKIGVLVSSEKAFAPYSGGFLIDQPTFDQKSRIWSFPATGKLLLIFPEAPLFFFEIQDSDGYFRVGSLTGRGYSPKSSEKFRMGPSVRAKVSHIHSR
jgi:hypothetical protein